MLQIRRAWVAEARTLAGISLSITVTMFAQLAISAAETLIVARLGVHVLAWVTLALSVYLLVFLFALGVVTAVTPIVAQAHGRGDAEGLKRSGQQGLWVGLTFSIPGVALLVGFSSIIKLAFGKGPEAVSASNYLLGAAWGLPAWVCYVAVRSLAIATGRVRITTIIMLASVPVHAGLTWWLVFGGFGLPPLGAVGAGFAYSLTAFGAWGLLMTIVRTSPVGVEGPSLRKRTVAVLHAMLRVGLASAGLSMSEERLKAEFNVAHGHDALDGAFAQFASQSEDIGGHGAQVPVLRLRPVEFARLVF